MTSPRNRPKIQVRPDERFKTSLSFGSHSAGIFLKNASAKWTLTQSDNTMTNISLSVTPGALLAVIGPVGSGKSSLFHVILQELALNGGNLEVNGEISYASQEPWLFAGKAFELNLWQFFFQKRWHTKCQIPGVKIWYSLVIFCQLLLLFCPVLFRYRL